jgi:hypothetical protein
VESGPALLAITVAIVSAVATVAVAAMAVRRSRDAGRRCRDAAAELDDRRPLVGRRIGELRDLLTRSRGTVRRISARATALDEAQVRSSVRLAAARQRLERLTESGMVPLARWLERLRILFRIVRLRREVFG